jgi:hypothetical protein
MSARTLSLSLSRRAFLTGLGAAALGPYLPLLNASGQEPLFPKRLLLFFTPHGTITQAWKPTGSETDFKLGRLLAPLAPHQSKLCVVSGVNMQDVGVGAPHTKGVPLLWTGSKLLDDGTFVREDGSGGPTYGWNASASVDQVIAERIGSATTFRSLEFGVRCGSSGPSNRMIYSAAKQPLQPATDPWAQYARLFTGGGEQVGAERLAALQLAREELKGISPKIASEDRSKVDAHIASLDRLEQRLRSKAMLCAGPSLSAKVNAGDVANTPAVVDAQIELITAAFACDLTRVASFQYAYGETDNFPYPFLGINEGHHTISHAPDSDAAAWEKIAKIRVWYAEKFSRLLERLDSIPEGNGTLLDNCLVVWGTEVGVGNTHSFRSTPFVVAGGAGGAVPTGRYLEFGEKLDHNRLLVSLCHAMGLQDVNTFGNIDGGTGPLPGLVRT